MKRFLSLLLVVVMVCMGATAAFAIPGTQIGNKLTASITSAEPPQFIWNVDGDEYGIDDIGTKLSGVTATTGFTGPNNDVPSIFFNGNMLSTDLSAAYPLNVPGTSWDSAFVTWYVLIPEGATHVYYSPATSSTGADKIPLGLAGSTGVNMDGQYVMIGGLRYLKVLGQFAAKSLGADQKWAVTVGQSQDGIASMATFPIQFGTVTGDAWTQIDSTVIVRNIYGADFKVVEPAANIQLSWATGEDVLVPNASGEMTVNAGYTFKMGVRLQNTGTGALSNGLVVMTIKKGGVAVMSGVTATCGGVSVGKGADYYYWGPSTGFPISTKYDATSIFDVKFAEAGTYQVEIFVVDLNVNAE